MRICQLALNLDTTSQVLLKLCRNLGLDSVKSHRSLVSDNEELMLRQLYRAEYMPAPKVVAPPVEHKPAPPKPAHESNKHAAPKHDGGHQTSPHIVKKPFIKKRSEIENRDGERRYPRPQDGSSDRDSTREIPRLKKKRKVIIISGELKKVELRDKDHSHGRRNDDHGDTKKFRDNREPRDSRDTSERRKSDRFARDDKKPAFGESVDVGNPKIDRTKVGKQKKTYDKKFGETEDRTAKKTQKQRQKDRIDPYAALLGKEDDSFYSHRKGKKKVKFSAPKNKTPINVKPKEIVLDKQATIKEVSAAFGIQMNTIISEFFKEGIMKRANDYLNEDEITQIALAHEVDFKFHEVHSKMDDLEINLVKMTEEEDDEETLQSRPPIVTMLGHVDHGKTSLLDYIRKSGIAKKEDGGITQHIGASVVHKEAGDIVFIDTPGHEAFTQMRARGAQLTDIAILVVAADDGVMPTTQEAYDHIKAAGVEIIVALNKIDKHDANPTKVKGELAKMGLVPTADWGGDTEVIECSAITGQGIDDLLETVLLQAEMMNLQENPNKKATGFVLESNKTEKEGVFATLLVKKGTLKVGDNVVVGKTFGRVRAMFDDKGKSIDTVGPAYPAKVLGLNEPPVPGDQFYVIENIAHAHKLADTRKINLKLEEQASKTKVTAENLLSMIQAGEVKEVNLVIKGDTVGSIEVLKAQISKLENKEVRTNIIRAGVGAVTENDILLAASANAIIIGFHVIDEPEARQLAKLEQVEIRHFRVIYELIDFVKGVLEGHLAPEKVEHKLGRAEIRKVFFSSKHGNIAGCYVVDGVVRRNAKVRIYRNGKEISPESGYSLSSLKQGNDDAREMKKGFECGMVVENFNDIKVGDILEFFEFEERKRKLDEVE